MQKPLSAPTAAGQDTAPYPDPSPRCQPLTACLAGRFPFANSLDAELNAAEAVQAMFQRILRADFIPLTWISPLCADLLALLLCVDPASRITMDQLLCHPWFIEGEPPLGLCGGCMGRSHLLWGSLCW